MKTSYPRFGNDIPSCNMIVRVTLKWVLSKQVDIHLKCLGLRNEFLRQANRSNFTWSQFSSRILSKVRYRNGESKVNEKNLMLKQIK